MRLGSSTTDYGYNEVNELTSDGANSYSYDATGNRTNTGYETITGNRLQKDGTWTYSYDAEGNRLQKTKADGETWTYAYDHHNHLTVADKRLSETGPVVQRVVYGYDALGNRVEKTVDLDGEGPQAATTTRFALDVGPSGLWDVWADLDQSNALKVRYLRGDAVDELFARVRSEDPSGAWYLTDHQGTVRDLANVSGDVINHLDYDAFGRVTGETNPSVGDRWRYTGRRRLAACGRLRHPGCSRWPGGGTRLAQSLGQGLRPGSESRVQWQERQ